VLWAWSFRQKLRADWPADQTSGVPISPRQRGTTAPSHGQLALRQGGEPLPPAWGAPVRARTPRSRAVGVEFRDADAEHQPNSALIGVPISPPVQSAWSFVMLMQSISQTPS